MAQLIKSPSVIKGAGNIKETIKEYFGLVSSKTPEISIAHIKSPEGWEEPGQCPKFNEYKIVLKGKLKITTKNEEFILAEGQGIMVSKDEWVRNSAPFKGGAEYITVCLPAFSLDLVNRDK